MILCSKPILSKNHNTSIKNSPGIKKWSLRLIIIGLISYKITNCHARLKRFSTTQTSRTLVAIAGSKEDLLTLAVDSESRLHKRWMQRYQLKSAVNTDSHSPRWRIMLKLIAKGGKQHRHSSQKLLSNVVIDRNLTRANGSRNKLRWHTVYHCRR